MSGNHISLPAEYNHNRIIVQPRTKEGVRLNLLVDTGGDMYITPQAVQRAKLKLAKREQNGILYDVAELPKYDDIEWIPSLLIEGKPPKLAVIENPVDNSDGMLGQAWLAERVWTFDYITQKFIYHQQHLTLSIKNENCVTLGFQNDEKGQRKLNFPRIQAIIDNEEIDFLFDTGATANLSEEALNKLDDGEPAIRGTSFIISSKLQQWRERHHDWRVIENAEGNLAMIEVPELILAGYKVGTVWFIERPDSNFHNFMSQWMDKKVDGALGGSAFKYFRITVDYPNAVAHFEH